MLVFGHRGASGYAPENTLVSFKKALELGVDGVELDVYVLPDGSVVVIHDEKVDRTTNGKGKVTSKSLQELQQLDAGNGEKIPTLQEVLHVVNKKTKVNIELKGKNTALPASEIIKDFVQHKGWKYNDFIVSSFDHSELYKFKQLLPEVKIGALIVGIFINFDNYVNELHAYSVNMWVKFVRKPVVEEAHKRGLKLFVYTVNKKKDIEKMKKLGVDGVFSDYPDRVK